jgi:hypothetical protein
MYFPSNEICLFSFAIISTKVSFISIKLCTEFTLAQTLRALYHPNYYFILAQQELLMIDRAFSLIYGMHSNDIFINVLTHIFGYSISFLTIMVFIL